MEDQPLKSLTNRANVLFASIALLGISVDRVSALPQLPDPRIDWVMPDRFGQMDSQGKIEYHWDGDARVYDTDFVHPAAWPVLLRGDSSRTVANQPWYRGTDPLVSFTFEVNGQKVTSSQPNVPYSFPNLGTYPVKLTVRSLHGRTNTTTQNVVVKDYLIVSIGDSMASGEGVPDFNQTFDFLGFVKSGPKWEDRRCHISEYSYAAQAALAIERADPHTSVTFLSFACSGAGIDDGILKDHYADVDTKEKGWETRQLSQVRLAIDQPVFHFHQWWHNYRAIDALIITVGANDVHFADIAKNFWTYEPAYWYGWVVNPIHSDFDHLQQRYHTLGQTIHDELRYQNASLVKNVYLTEYPDPTHNENGEFARFPGFLGGIHHLPLGISGSEAEWLHDHVVERLNSTIHSAVAEINHNIYADQPAWVCVDGIAEEFDTHGISAGNQRWFQTLEDSIHKQGPIFNDWERYFKVLELGQEVLGQTKGTLHPNKDGHQAIMRHVLDFVTPRL